MSNFDVNRILIACHAETVLKGLDRPFIEVCNLTSKEIPSGFEYYLSGISNLESPNWVWSELTTLVEGQKFLGDATYVGLQHYRRFFALDIESSENPVIKRSLLERNIIAKKQAEYLEVFKNKVVVPAPETFAITVFAHFKKLHFDSLVGLEIACAEFNRRVGSRFGNINSLQSLKETKKLHPYNMFLGPHDFYREWLEILIPILSILDENRDLFPIEGYQSRWAGFIVERIFSIYIDFCKQEGKWRILERPIYFLQNELDYYQTQEALEATQEALEATQEALEATQEALEATQEALEATLNESREQINVIHQSMSWKLSKPIRILSRLRTYFKFR